MTQSLLSNRDRMEVVRFLARLTRDPGLARALARTPDELLDSSGLSPAARTVLETRDQDRIATALGQVGVEI